MLLATVVVLLHTATDWYPKVHWCFFEKIKEPAPYSAGKKEKLYVSVEPIIYSWKLPEIINHMTEKKLRMMTEFYLIQTLLWLLFWVLPEA